MTVSDAEIRQRLHLGEDSAWEFKQVEFNGNRPTSPRRDDLADNLADAFGAELSVIVVDIIGRSSLVEYRSLRP